MANHNNVPGAGWQSWVFDVSIRVTVAHVELGVNAPWINSVLWRAAGNSCTPTMSCGRR